MERLDPAQRPGSRRFRRMLLGGAALVVFAAPSCGQTPGPASVVETLRVLAVTADNTYAAPGDTVTLRMTYSDAGKGPDGARPIEVTWLGGCLDPANGDFMACYPALAPALQAVGAGEAVPGLAAQELAPPEKSGVPGAVAFDLTIPADALQKGAMPGSKVPRATAYVFFAACAGKVRPISVGDEGGFPLECIGDEGEALAGDSFVVGFTRVQIFPDGRENQNPPALGLTVDGKALGADPDSAPVVARCEKKPAQRQGCGQRQSNACTTYQIEAVVGDVAEEDTESSPPGGTPLREAVWVNHFTDKGSFNGSTRLISDSTTGYVEDHGTTFTPPSEAGILTLWAVVRDSRGGVDVTRGFLRVE